MLDDFEPVKRTRPRWLWPLLSIILVLAVVGFLTAFSLFLKPEDSSIGSAASKKGVEATVVVPTQANAVAPNLLFDLKGHSNTNSATYSIGGAWDLYWAYDCTGSGQGNFTVYTYDTAKRVFEPGRVAEFGAKGTNLVHYPDAGTYYLQVISSCAWNVKGVVEP